MRWLQRYSVEATLTAYGLVRGVIWASQYFSSQFSSFMVAVAGALVVAGGVCYLQVKSTQIKTQRVKDEIDQHERQEQRWQQAKEVMLQTEQMNLARKQLQENRLRRLEQTRVEREHTTATTATISYDVDPATAPCKWGCLEHKVTKP